MHTTPKQHTFWLLAAIAAPVAHASGCGWLTAGLTALAVLPLSLLPKRWEGMPKPVALAQILWLGIVAGTLLRGSTAYWPSDNRFAVPLTILALAVFTNAAAAPRIGAVLALCMAMLAIPQAVSAAANLKAQWLRPALSPWSPGLAAALLLPALPGVGGKGKGRTAAGVLTVALAAMVQGVISPQAAAVLPDPFYQTARTLGYLEPVAAVMMTLGWYAMTVWILQSAAQIAKISNLGRLTANILPVWTATGTVFILQQPFEWFLPILSVVFWVLIPFLQKLKNFEKSEK